MKQNLISILHEIRPEFDFQQNGNFIKEGMLDSFDIVSLVTALDDYYNISIDGMDIMPENFVSIESIINLLVKTGAK